jgi:NAD(P)-dependent dehydrogenase (short-subunit alcohol dehydrogenase family)
VTNQRDRTVQDLMRLDGKMSVVTGGGGHLGLEISRSLLELGSSVVVIGRDPAKIGPLQAGYPGRVEFMGADLNERDAVLGLKAALPTRIDVLVNNAVTWPSVASFHLVQWEDVNATLTSGVTSPIMLSKIVFDRMREQGGGVIINNASMYGIVSPDFRIYRDSGMSNAIQYNAAKAAMIQVTKYLAVIGAPHGIRVNAFSPGPFSHPGAFAGKEWFREELEAMMPLARIGQKWEIKGVIAFLATDLSTYVTGQNIPVDGGWTTW